MTYQIRKKIVEISISLCHSSREQQLFLLDSLDVGDLL